MILVVCKDDEKALQKIALDSKKAHQNAFGDVYLIFHGQIPNLKKTENLFIIAHGAFDDKSGNPVIGDKNKAFFLNGVDLWDNISGIFPQDYAANVFIDACESADHNNEVFSFIEVFYTQFYISNNGIVFGKNGASSGLIPIPGDPKWIPATLNKSSNQEKLSLKTISTMENQSKAASGQVTNTNADITNNQQLTKFRRLKDLATKRRDYKNAIAANLGDSPPAPNYNVLTIPGQDPSNQEAVKYYAFNQTGNIMMSSTDLSSDGITQSVRDVFNEVSVFFAAMTKAISTTVDPLTNQPYSIYNYTALGNIISGSGLFVHVTEEDISYNSQSAEVDVSKELIEGLLGLATGSGELSFAEAMISSMGSEGLKMQESTTSSDKKVANIVFVCEYLLGMPIVSAIVVYCDMSSSSQHIQVGPCISETSTQTSLTMHKDTYLFVTPKFIKEYAGDLLSVEADGIYNELVDYLADLVLAKADIVSVTISGSATAAPSALTKGTSYQINGECFGTTAGKLSIGTTPLKVGTWNNNYITFTAPAAAVTTAALLNLFMPNNSTTIPDASSLQTYTVA